MGPGIITLHGRFDQQLPGSGRVPVNVAGIPGREEQFVSIDVGEGKACPGAGKAIKRNHSIFQAAGLAYDRQSAITHRNHLRQAAGFKKRRHQEQIGGGVKPMG